MTRAPLCSLVSSSEACPLLGDKHLVVAGKTGMGKSGLAQHFARIIARWTDEGFTFLDPKGDTARAIAEWLANPLNGSTHRAVHILTAAHAQHSFGLNPLQTEEATPQAWHDAATIVTSAIANYFRTAIQETPHLERIVQCAAALLAEKNLTLYDMPALLTLGGEHLRDYLLSNSQNRIYAGEITDLERIAKSPARFLEVCQSTKNRLVTKLGNPALARIFCQRRGLNPRAVMDAGELVLVDTSALRPDDAAFVNTMLTSLYVSAAFRRTPNVCRMHRLFLEEAADMLLDQTAVALDTTRKFGLAITAFIQRLGQAKDKTPLVFDALMVNTIKVVFALPEPDSADYLSRLLFSSVIDLAEWKPGTERPVALGHDKVILHNSSRAEHNAEATSTSTSDIRSFGTAFASISADIAGWGSGFSSSHTNSAHGAPAALGPNPIASLSQADTFGRSASNSGGRSSAHSVARQSARAQARTTSHSSASGHSTACGESEAYITRYEWMPSQTYSLQEQLFRYATLLMELPQRHCIVKLESQPPYLAHTADLSPAFADQNFKKTILPRFLELSARESPYVIPVAQAEAELAARSNGIFEPEPQPEPDFTEPEDVPILDGLERARDLIKSRQPDPPGRPSNAPNLRIVDGGKSDGDIPS
jgi:hypothetical protein